jgi:superfamily I DNA/RNA helicase
MTEGPLLIVAGPGTGKTRTLTHRLAAIVESGVPGGQCLAITFTRRAAEELAERLTGLLGESDVTVATFHRLGLDILRAHHALLDLPSDFGIADEAARKSMVPQADLRAISLAKRTSAVDEDVAQYDKALRSAGLVDFDDLLVLPVRLLSERPDIAARYRERFRHICVDEYQDVDDLQYRLLRLLCPPDGNLCAIGDPDQAIYSFRGADVGFFLRFQEDFPTASVVALTRNYRSSPAIVSGAVAAVAPTSLVPDRVLTAMRDNKNDASAIVIRSTVDEAVFVVHTIEELLGGSSFHAHDTGKVAPDGVGGGLSFDDIAILYRTASQTGPLMAALSRSGLPYQRRSHDRLRDHPGVKTLVPYLRDTPVRPAADAALADGADADEIAAAVELLAPLAAVHEPAALLAELLLGSEVDTWDPRANRISLLTLHAAKGLEFPVVFVVGCDEGVLPLRSADSVDEERRLFFVGVSRAQSHLYLTHGERPSRFLSALPSSVAVRARDTANRPRKPAQLRLL